MRYFYPHRALSVAVFVVSLVGASGCGSGKGSVTGKVKINGREALFEGLQISLMGDDGRPICADVNADGTYRVEGVSAGTYKVGVNYLSPDATKALEEQAKARKPPRPPAPGDDTRVTPEQARQLQKDLERMGKTGGGLQPPPPAVKNPIPERYRDPRESPLSTTVEAGKDTVLDIDVTP